jgi:hypothetical protein
LQVTAAVDIPVLTSTQGLAAAVVDAHEEPTTERGAKDGSEVVEKNSIESNTQSSNQVSIY